MKRLLIILTAFFLLFVAAAVLLEKYKPILVKWATGSARIIGKPIHAIVFTDGHINNDIQVYRENTYWDGKNSDAYILKLKHFDKDGMLEFININLDEKWIGRPVSTDRADYDVINGSLFQSDVSYHCSDFRDDMKGFNFDPHLEFNDREIKFNVPPGWLKFDSVRIELN